MTMQKTFSEVQEIIQEGSVIENAKFQFALKKLSNQIKKSVKVYNDLMEEKRIDYCSVDEKGNVIKDEKGGYVFTKENLKALTKEAQLLAVIEFEPFFCYEQIEYTEEQIELFKGIIIE